MHFIPAFITVSLATICIDFLWIGFVARNTLVSLIKPYLTFDASGNLITRIPYAIACWLLIAAGTYLFVTKQMPENSSWLNVFSRGALFGLVTYGIYDLTNAALQIQWPFTMILLDVGWGMVLCGTCALLWRLVL